MSAKEQLLHELEDVSDALVEEILDFCLFLKQRQQSKVAEQSTLVESQTNGILDFLERVKEIQTQVPSEEWNKLPHDGSINHDHYLYGVPKVEE